MAARIADISDFTPTETEAFERQVRQSLGFLEAAEGQVAKTWLGSIHRVAAQIIRDRRQHVGSTR